MLIEHICDYIHNYFVIRNGKHRGKFTVAGGSLLVDFLLPNQYFKVVGSIFNDGIYQYGVDTLTDETFIGEVWAMGVPPALLALAEEISAWMDKYGGVVESPYSSESFGGYSYTKATGASGNNSEVQPGAGWQAVFASRLNHWRKIS